MLEPAEARPRSRLVDQLGKVVSRYHTFMATRLTANNQYTVHYVQTIEEL